MISADAVKDSQHREQRWAGGMSGALVEAAAQPAACCHRPGQCRQRTAGTSDEIAKAASTEAWAKPQCGKHTKHSHERAWSAQLETAAGREFHPLNCLNYSGQDPASPLPGPSSS